MNEKSVRIERKIYPDFEKITPEEINRKLERFKVQMNFLFDDGIEFLYDPSLDVRYFPGDVSFVNKQKDIIVLSYLEGFSSIEFFVGGDLDDDTEPYLTIPIYNLIDQII